MTPSSGSRPPARRLGTRTAVRTARAVLPAAVLLAAGACGAPPPPEIRAGAVPAYEEAISRADTNRPLLVNHFALWCQPCMEEMPYLLDLARRRDDVDFLAVSWDLTVEKSERGAMKKLAAFFRREDVPFPILLFNGDGVSFLPALGVQKGAIPFTILYDGSGEVAERFEEAFLGPDARARLEKALDRLVSASG